MALQRLWSFLRQSRINPTTPIESAKQKKLLAQVEQSLVQCKKEDFAGLRRQFAFFIRPVLSEFVLRRGWSLLRTMFGPVVSTDVPTMSSGWFTDSARLPIQFRRAKMVMVMQFTKSGSVVGLRFLPPALAGMGAQVLQEWQPPAYAVPDSYKEAEITLGRSGVKVGGTVTLPDTEQKCACVILLAGSGPSDRDSTLQAAKPFKDLAIGLAGKDIATIRFDKVTLTHGEKVARNSSFTLTDEYVEHASAAIEYAQKHSQISSDSIYLLGHSLGAVVVPKISESMPAVTGMILMAAPTQPMYWAAVRQLEYLSELDSDSSETADDEGLEELRRAASLADSPELSTSTPADKLPFGIGNHYWLDYHTYKPVQTVQQSSKPILILQGEKDYQVTMKDDFVRWLDATKNMPNVDSRLYSTLNHLFIPVEGQSRPSDYGKSCNVDSQVIEEIADWVLEQRRCKADHTTKVA